MTLKLLTDSVFCSLQCSYG